MSITTAEKEWLKRLGSNKPVKNDKHQTEEKPRNKVIQSNTTKAGKGFEDVAGMTQLKELVVEGFINVLKNKECAEVYEQRCCSITSRSEQERRLPLLQLTCLSLDGKKC